MTLIRVFRIPVNGTHSVNRSHQVLSLEYKADFTSFPTLTSTPPPRRKNINTPPEKFRYQGDATIRLSYLKLDSYFIPSLYPLTP